MQAGGGVLHEDYHLQARTDSIKTITNIIDGSSVTNAALCKQAKRWAQHVLEVRRRRTRLRRTSRSHASRS